jgi:hypothetical protein
MRVADQPSIFDLLSALRAQGLIPLFKLAVLIGLEGAYVHSASRADRSAHNFIVFEKRHYVNNKYLFLKTFINFSSIFTIHILSKCLQ